MQTRPIHLQSLSWMAASGHEDQFRPPSLSGGCRLGKATFAGTGGKERDAPIPAVRGTAIEPTGRRLAVIGSALIVLVDNNMVGRRIHGMIASGGRLKEVRK